MCKTHDIMESETEIVEIEEKDLLVWTYRGCLCQCKISPIIEVAFADHIMFPTTFTAIGSNWSDDTCTSTINASVTCTFDIRLRQEDIMTTMEKMKKMLNDEIDLKYRYRELEHAFAYGGYTVRFSFDDQDFPVAYTIYDSDNRSLFVCACKFQTMDGIGKPFRTDVFDKYKESVIQLIDTMRPIFDKL